MCRHGRLLGVARTSCRSRISCYRGPGSTLGQRRYPSSCVTVSPNQLTLNRISQRSDVVGKQRESLTIVNLPVTNVPRSIGSNTKTLGWKHLQFPNLGSNGGPPDRARISCLYSRTPFLVERPFLLFRRGPSTSSHCVAFFLPDRYDSTR